MAVSTSFQYGLSSQNLSQVQTSGRHKEADSLVTQQNFGIRIRRQFYNTMSAAEFFVEGSEAFEKILKNSQRGLEIASKIESISKPIWKVLSVSCKNAIDVFESIRFLGVVTLLFTPQKNNKYFLYSPEHSIQKKCDRLFLLAHTGCKTIRAASKWKLIDLGYFGKLKIGPHLPVFTLLTDGLMLASCSFSIWDMWLKITGLNQEEHEIKKKIEFRQDRPLNLAQALQGDQAAFDKLQKNLVDKIEQIKNELALDYKDLYLVNDLLNQPINDRNSPGLKNESDLLNQKISRLEIKLEKNQTRLQHLNARNYEPLINDCTEKNIIEKVNDRRKIKEKDFVASKIDQVKLASSIAKIFVITMALVMTAVNVWTTIPTIILLSCGIIADSIGLAKLFLERGPKLL